MTTGNGEKNLPGSLLLRWLAPFAWMSLIFFLSSFSSLPSLEEYDTFFKKGAHFFVYAVLYLLLFRAFRATLSGKAALSRPLRTGLWAGAVAVLFAVSDEIHQAFVPFRNPALRDVLIDSAGVLFMSVIVKKGGRLSDLLLDWPGPRNREDRKPQRSAG